MRDRLTFAARLIDGDVVCTCEGFDHDGNEVCFVVEAALFHANLQRQAALGRPGRDRRRALPGRPRRRHDPGNGVDGRPRRSCPTTWRWAWRCGRSVDASG